MDGNEIVMVVQPGFVGLEREEWEDYEMEKIWAKAVLLE